MYNENQSARRCGKCHSHKHQKSSGAIKQGQIQVVTNDSNLEATLLTSSIKVKLVFLIDFWSGSSQKQILEKDFKSEDLGVS